MTYPAVDIERVVQEVVRRLHSVRAAQHASSAAGSGLSAQRHNDGDAGGDGDKRHGETDPHRKPGRDNVEGDLLVLNDRVVSLETLTGRIDGVTRVQISQGSVVTPAVLDELRHRGIALHRSQNSPENLLVWNAVSQPAKWPPSLRHELPAARWIERPETQYAVSDVVQHMLRGGGRTVVASHVPHVFACAVNRHSGIRAAYAACERSVREALQTLAINVLVLDVDPCGTREAAGWISLFFADQSGAPSPYGWLR